MDPLSYFLGPLIQLVGPKNDFLDLLIRFLVPLIQLVGPEIQLVDPERDFLGLENSLFGPESCLCFRILCIYIAAIFIFYQLKAK